MVLEAGKAVGGRIQTDIVDGYRFDHGFQVLQTAYPEAIEMLDYNGLNLQMFPPGVRIWADEAFHILADPRRYPANTLGTLFSRVGTMGDRLRLARLAMDVSRTSVEALFEREEKLTLEFLRSYGFSEKMIGQFFKPFMTGISLDPDVRVSNRFLLFVLKMFTQGDVGVPALGMGEIPKQLAGRLPVQTLKLDSFVDSLEGTTITLASGEKVRGRAIVLAANGPETARLTGRTYSSRSSREICLYYSAEQVPVEHPFLTLNGSGAGFVNSVNFPSMVAPDYAPPGKFLISVVVPGETHESATELERAVRKELKGWFGNQVEKWHLLHPYIIQHALPQPVPPSPNPFTAVHHLGNNVFDCSEFATLPAIQWALLAGKRGAESVHTVLAGE